VGVATDYGLDGRCSIPGRGKIPLLQNGLGPTQPPILWVPRLKQPGLEADDSTLYSAEVKTGGAIPPLPLYLHGTETTLPLISSGFIWLTYRFSFDCRKPLQLLERRQSNQDSMMHEFAASSFRDQAGTVTGSRALQVPGTRGPPRRFVTATSAVNRPLGSARLPGHSRFHWHHDVSPVKHLLLVTFR
jgi:hypothetical protein